MQNETDYQWTMTVRLSQVKSPETSTLRGHVWQNNFYGHSSMFGSNVGSSVSLSHPDPTQQKVRRRWHTDREGWPFKTHGPYSLTSGQDHRSWTGTRVGELSDKDDRCRTTLKNVLYNGTTWDPWPVFGGPSEKVQWVSPLTGWPPDILLNPTERLSVTFRIINTYIK